MTLNDSRPTRWFVWPIGALLFVCGCAGSKPGLATAEEDYGQEVPSEQPQEQTQPNMQEPAEPESPPAAGPQEAPIGAPADSVTNDEINAFADIQIALVPLQEQFSQQAQSGASQEELLRLQGQLEQQMAQIVQESALSQERFNEIGAMVQRDGDLLRRVQTAIQQRTGGF